MTDEPNNPIDEPRRDPADPTAVCDAAGPGAEAAPQTQAEAPAAPPAVEATPPAADEPAPPAAEPAPMLTEPPPAEAQAALPEPTAPSPAEQPEAGPEATVEPPAAEDAGAEAAQADAAQTVAETQPAALQPAKKAKKKPAKDKAKEETKPEKPAEPKSANMDWYILKVQSNREDSIREGLLRRVAIAGLDRFFGDVIVPTEKVTEFKGGKKRVTKRKLYPGYLVVQMEVNEETWYLVRETPGIGDFTGGESAKGERRPSPMLPHEVSRILAKKEEKADEAPKLKIGFHTGDRVKIIEGTFENFEGEVSAIDETNGRVTVMINIFGRSTPVEFEYWQIEGL